MDLEIQDILENKYKNLYIEVSYKDVRKYNIKIRINYKNIMYETLIEYNYEEIFFNFCFGTHVEPRFRFLQR